LSCAVGTCGVTLPWYGVAMVESPLTRRPLFAPIEGHEWAVSWKRSRSGQARKQETEAGLVAN
jgi:hypothetical protein